MIEFPLTTTRQDKGNSTKLFSYQSLHKINTLSLL